MKRLILVGGGHAHLHVLDHLASNRPLNTEVVLVSPQRWQYYSGMLPGWIAGQYDWSDCRIDLRPLAKAARARFVEQPVVGMDAQRRCICLSSGEHLYYDLLSLDVGSETDDAWLCGLGQRLMTIKRALSASASPVTLAGLWREAGHCILGEPLRRRPVGMELERCD